MSLPTKSNISCYYHPTTVVFVDDNRFFLDSVLFELDENIKARSFTEPAKAIEYLKERELVPFIDKYLKPCKDQEDLEVTGGVEHSYMAVELFNIHREIYNPNRFDTVVVVVVDYTMPGMNGLEFCKVLQGLPFKIVLITGDATLNNAIDAFNAGLIDQFISKSDPCFTSKLQETIFELQEKQFEDFSNVIVKNLSAFKSLCSGDSFLVEFLKDFFKKNNIVEYYIINESGCFLLVDFVGDLSWIVIKSEDEMSAYTDAAIDNYGSKEVINELASRDKVLFLCSEADHVNLSVDDWQEYLYPATKLIGRDNTYYYSHIKGVCNQDISTDKLVSYKDFLETR